VLDPALSATLPEARLERSGTATRPGATPPGVPDDRSPVLVAGASTADSSTGASVGEEATGRSAGAVSCVLEPVDDEPASPASAPGVAGAGAGGVARGALAEGGAGSATPGAALDGGGAESGEGADGVPGDAPDGTLDGSSVSGSTYPSSSAVTRTPRWTYGSSNSGVPLGPIVPTTSPSRIAEPFFTEIEPRCVRMTEYPSAVSTVTTFPLVGTVPANETAPPAAARTSEPAGPATSMPRCWPPAYGWFLSNENGRSTAPFVGQVHALATPGKSAALTRATRSIRRIAPSLLSDKKTAISR
jgi:hypothetical protein